MDKVRGNINGFSFVTSPFLCRGLIIRQRPWYSWPRILKVTPCSFGRMVVNPNFFGLIGYHYFVYLWGYASSTISCVCQHFFSFYFSDVDGSSMQPFNCQCKQKRMVVGIRQALLDRPKNKTKATRATPGVILNNNSTKTLNERKDLGSSLYLSPERRGREGCRGEHVVFEGKKGWGNL